MFSKSQRFRDAKSLCQTNSRLRGTHRTLSPELSEGKKLTQFGVWNCTLRTVFGPPPRPRSTSFENITNPMFMAKICHWLTGKHSSIGAWPSTNTIRAEIVTESILKRSGPIIFETFLLELNAFRLIPVICSATRAKPQNYWKL